MPKFQKSVTVAKELLQGSNETIQVGFSASGSLISRIIRFFTRSQTSHAFLRFITKDGKDLVLEALGNGVQVSDFTGYSNDNKIVDLLEINTQDPDRIWNIALTHLREAYDFQGLLGQLWVQIWRFLRIKLHSPLQNHNAVFCSELIVLILQTAGIGGLVGIRAEDISPGDLLEMLRGSSSFQHKDP